jgi:hypothetical protein|tara:strand:+ start:7295 stop:8026 length:732 start_codon:yes stop_codon:yes gene_type:complete
MSLTPTKFLNDNRIDIARGLVRGVSHINKFGYNPTVGTDFESVIDASNLYTYIASAGTAQATSSNTSDDNGGTVLVSGLNANYEEVSETLTIGGAAGSIQFFRVFRAILLTANTGSTNSGIITITADSKTTAQILASKGQTLMALYTIPTNKKGYLMKFQGNLEKAKECEFEIMARPPTNGNTAFNIKGKFGSSGAPVNYDYPVPLEFDEKTDIEVRVKAGATTGAGAIFDLLLIEQPIGRNL